MQRQLRAQLVARPTDLYGADGKVDIQLTHAPYTRKVDQHNRLPPLKLPPYVDRVPRCHWFGRCSSDACCLVCLNCGICVLHRRRLRCSVCSGNSFCCRPSCSGRPRSCSLCHISRLRGPRQIVRDVDDGIVFRCSVARSLGSGRGLSGRGGLHCCRSGFFVRSRGCCGARGCGGARSSRGCCSSGSLVARRLGQRGLLCGLCRWWCRLLMANVVADGISTRWLRFRRRLTRRRQCLLSRFGFCLVSDGHHGYLPLGCCHADGGDHVPSRCWCQLHLHSQTSCVLAELPPHHLASSPELESTLLRLVRGVVTARQDSPRRAHARHTNRRAGRADDEARLGVHPPPSRVNGERAHAILCPFELDGQLLEEGRRGAAMYEVVPGRPTWVWVSQKVKLQPECVRVVAELHPLLLAIAAEPERPSDLPRLPLARVERRRERDATVSRKEDSLLFVRNAEGLLGLSEFRRLRFSGQTRDFRAVSVENGNLDNVDHAGVSTSAAFGQHVDAVGVVQSCEALRRRPPFFRRVTERPLPHFLSHF
mmetsp:Transcript_40374/g.133636  ORF Transcript_40374/g.133636 Transcript_40374/m.133636 type:complete len:537 (+) Transcript_40374:288-1898(+)